MRPGRFKRPGRCTTKLGHHLDRRSPFLSDNVKESSESERRRKREEKEKKNGEEETCGRDTVRGQETRAQRRRPAHNRAGSGDAGLEPTPSSLRFVTGRFTIVADIGEDFVMVVLEVTSLVGLRELRCDRSHRLEWS